MKLRLLFFCYYVCKQSLVKVGYLYSAQCMVPELLDYFLGEYLARYVPVKCYVLSRLQHLYIVVCFKSSHYLLFNGISKKKSIVSYQEWLLEQGNVWARKFRNFSP